MRRGLRRKQVGFLGSSRDAGLFADHASEFCDEFRNLGIAQPVVIAGKHIDADRLQRVLTQGLFIQREDHSGCAVFGAHRPWYVAHRWPTEDIPD